MLYAQSETSEATERIQGFKRQLQQTWQQIKHELEGHGYSYSLPKDAFIARLCDNLSGHDQLIGLSVASAIRCVVKTVEQIPSAKSKITSKISSEMRLEPRQILLTAVLLKIVLDRAFRPTVRNATGTISCTFDCEDNQCLLTVHDDGTGLREILAEHELPLVVGFAAQLDGTLKWHLFEGGTCLEVSFAAVRHQQIVEFEEVFSSAH